MTLNDGIVGETMPTEWEEEVVRKYVNERAIDRPNTSIFTALIFVSMFVLVSLMRGFQKRLRHRLFASQQPV